ncbi:hypothetical protein ACP4OV_031982 [Aristida adscensionis]
MSVVAGAATADAGEQMSRKDAGRRRERRATPCADVDDQLGRCDLAEDARISGSHVHATVRHGPS